MDAHMVRGIAPDDPVNHRLAEHSVQNALITSGRPHGQGFRLFRLLVCFSEAQTPLEEEGVLPGRLIEVAFSDIATMENGIKEPKAVVNGKWSLRWKLEGVSETTRKECCFAIGDTGATVKAIEIAPMSVKLKIERPYEENTGGWTDSVGPLTNVLPPPAFAGVRMKDGQIRTVAEDYIVETQCARFEERVDTDTAVFTETVYFTRIIDMDNVTAFLFENPAYQVQKAEILIPVTFGTE